jgi:hypothetical protein
MKDTSLPVGCLSVDDKIDRVLGYILEQSKLVPDGFPFRVHWEKLLKLSQLNEDELWGFVGGVLCHEYDVIDFVEVNEETVDSFEPKGKMRIRLNHQHLHDYLKDTGRLVTQQTTPSSAEKEKAPDEVADDVDIDTHEEEKSSPIESSSAHDESNEETYTVRPYAPMRMSVCYTQPQYEPPDTATEEVTKEEAPQEMIEMLNRRRTMLSRLIAETFVELANKYQRWPKKDEVWEHIEKLFEDGDKRAAFIESMTRGCGITWISPNQFDKGQDSTTLSYKSFGSDISKLKEKYSQYYKEIPS